MNRFFRHFVFLIFSLMLLMVWAGYLWAADSSSRNGDQDPKGLGLALHEACKNCNIKLVHAIIEAKPDFDFQDNFGETALHKAAGYCSGASVGIKIIKALLDAGANPSIKNHKNETPLSIAVKLGEEDMARVILENMKQEQKTTQ